MRYDILHRWSGAVIYSGEHDSRSAAILAAIRGDANLCGADLASANLASANLAGANLAGANLAGAKGLNKFLITPLLMLRDQPGAIRAYRLVTADGLSPISPGNGHAALTYSIGAEIVASANTDENEQCGAGVNLATLDWCLREWRSGYRVLIAEFTAHDIAAIPTATDGKFRVHRCRIVGEVDLAEIGWVPR